MVAMIPEGRFWSVGIEPGRDRSHERKPKDQANGFQRRGEKSGLDLDERWTPAIPTSQIHRGSHTDLLPVFYNLYFPRFSQGHAARLSSRSTAA